MFENKIEIISFIFIGLLSRSIAFDPSSDVQFELYTRDNRQVPQVIDTHGEPAIVNSKFQSTRPTRIFVHGYRSKHKVINRYAEAFLNAGDYNFIAVNWIEGASTVNYFTAKSRIKSIARLLAVVIDSFVDHGMQMRDLTLIGHSLGSHICGLAAKQLRSPDRIPVIIGLDPASVLFDFLEVNERLADTDADYVQIVHTDSGHYSFGEAMGHADFYPNGGSQQPGCKKKNIVTTLVDKCSHVRSHALFLESLSYNLPSVQCTSYEEILRGQCTKSDVVENMGGDLKHDSHKPMGIFYLETYNTQPYMKSIENFSQIQFITYFN